MIWISSEPALLLTKSRAQGAGQHHLSQEATHWTSVWWDTQETEHKACPATSLNFWIYSASPAMLRLASSAARPCERFPLHILPCKETVTNLHTPPRAALSLYNPSREVKEGGQNSWAQEEITQGAKDKKEGGIKCNVESALRAWRTEGACWRKRLKRKVRWSKIAK